jgi:phage tail protein X
MHTPFLVADPHSGLHYRLTDARLAELTLAPRPAEWVPGRVIVAEPDPVWAESLANAPVETIAAVTQALEGLVLATPDLRPPATLSLPDSRAGRHLAALVALWRAMGDALPEGMAVVRHVLALPRGRFVDPLPVVEGSLDPLVPPAMRALHDRLLAEFGTVPALPAPAGAPTGSRLATLQMGLARPEMETGPADDTIAFYGLRDPALCADFAAARARALIDGGCAARDIAVMTAADPRQLARAFAAQGVPLSGLPATLPERDIQGETLLHLLLAKRPPTPAMVLASLCLSPLMPWGAQTGRDLAEALMQGNFRARVLEATPDHKALWDDIRAPAASLAQLRFLMDRICDRLTGGATLCARLAPLLLGEGSPDWEAILRNVSVAPPTVADPDRNLEGVSLWQAGESPWRRCRHLIVTDFTEGHYPARPQANPLFLDSEIARIRETTGLALRGRAEGLARSLALFDEQLSAVSGSVTFLIPWRDLAGARLAPSAGLSLVARAIAGREAADLVIDLARLAPSDWPVPHQRPLALPAPPVPPEALDLGGRDLLGLRRDEAGLTLPQSPSRLETLLVSPLAWLLDELGAKDLSWSAEDLDALARGNIAHDVFEHVFLPDAPLMDDTALTEAVTDAYDKALTRHAGFLRSPSWEMERKGLERDITRAALRWRDHLRDLGARTIGNELWLHGEAHGIRLRGKADAILELPDGALLVVDHKKSGTAGRRRRMEAGWDLQAGLYRDMIARPIRTEGDDMGPLIGHKIGVAYHLMNDGGLLTSGIALPAGSPARDMGDAISAEAVTQLSARLAELGAGRIVLNTTEDANFFRKEAGLTPYALTDGSALVTAFLRNAPEE